MCSILVVILKLFRQLSRPDEVPDVGGSCVDEIVADDWRLGQVHFKVKWSSGDTT